MLPVLVVVLCLVSAPPFVISDLTPRASSAFWGEQPKLGSAPSGSFYNQKSRWTTQKLRDACIKNNPSYRNNFVCNPDALMSTEDMIKLNDALHATKVYDENSGNCPLEMRILLIRDLDDSLTFYKEGVIFKSTTQRYQRGVTRLAKDMAEFFLEQRRGDSIKSSSMRLDTQCQAIIVLLMSIEQGFIRYGLANNQQLKIEICRIKELMAQHSSSLYKSAYFHTGLKQLWKSIVKEYEHPKMTDCSPDYVYRGSYSSQASANYRNTAVRNYWALLLGAVMLILLL